MSFQTPAIYALLSAALVLLSLPAASRRRATILAIVSIVFVVMVMGGSVRALMALAGFLVLNYLAIRVMLLASRYRLFVFWLWLVLAVGAFIVLKQYWWITDLFVRREDLPHGIATIGLSFILFRQVSLAIEVRDGSLKEIGPVEFLTFNIAFWTFLAGPLQRFEAFRAQCAQWGAAEVSTTTTLLGLNRMMFGFLKTFIVSVAVNRYAIPSIFLVNPDFLHLLIFLMAFPVYLYLNFSGYCDLVIGFGQSVGFQLPENFDHPYKARNLNEFWARWHITLSELLRDFLFFPLQTALARRGSLTLATVAAAIASFLVMGAWHGNARSFLVFGLLHGLGVATVTLYTDILRRTLGKAALTRYRSSLLVRALAVTICQSYVVLTFLPFRYSAGDVGAVLHAARSLWGG